MNLSKAIFLVFCVGFAAAKQDYFNKKGDYTGRSAFSERKAVPFGASEGHLRNGGDVIEMEYPRQKRLDGQREAVGPVHTFVKTDEHAHFKWGVRHHIG